MKKVINFKVEKDIWEKEQEKAFNKLNKTAKIDGFRPGKAPRNVFEKKYGEKEILLEAADNLVRQKYMDIIKEEKEVPMVEPKVDLVNISKESLEVNFTLIVKSNVKLGKYKDLKVKKEAVKVEKEEIEHEIKHLQEHYAEMVEKDGEIVNGDTAIIDFEGFIDKVAFPGGKGENYSLEIGSNSFIPGFEEGLVGLKKGDEKTLELTFPKDYHAEDLKGKKVEFKVKVNDVKEKVIPSLDKEFFEDLDIEGVTNKEELENFLKENIKNEKEKIAENKYIDSILETASKNMEVEIDEELVHAEEERMYEDLLDKLAMQGLNEEIYLKYANTTKDAIMGEMKEEASKRIKYRYLLEAVIKEENITVTEEEVDKKIDEEIKKYSISKEDFLKEIGGLDVYKYDMVMRKAIDVMKESSK